MEKKPAQEGDLFRQVLEGVTPLKPSNRITPTAPPRKINIRAHHEITIVADNLSDHGASEESVNEFARAGINRQTLRKLRRGECHPQDSLDLHGLQSDAARGMLVNFLHLAEQNSIRCVVVIHGKGWRSGGREGLLKGPTRHWLTQHPQVLAFCEAPRNFGGGGAVLVLLRSSSPMG